MSELRRRTQGLSPRPRDASVRRAPVGECPGGRETRAPVTWLKMALESCSWSHLSRGLEMPFLVFPVLIKVHYFWRKSCSCLNLVCPSLLLVSKAPLVVSRSRDPYTNQGEEVWEPLPAH